ncbi:GntR family transcriptional regulator [Arthrobacter sp. zg-ZUI100]|nr:GntR family transcriptional regulator [Arthrobacter jiangjiafuii]
MDLILDSKLAAGSPLPTEAALCAALGVGRNTLRESLADQGRALAAVDSEFHRQLFEPLVSR